MKKRMIIMLVSLFILFACIAIYKIAIHFLVKQHFDALQNAPATISTMTVGYDHWQPTLNTVGSTRAITGVNVTTDLAGMVQTIYFTPGATVKVGTVLVQLNADTQIGQLKALQATQELDRITYERDKKQYAVHAVSKQTVDSDYQNLKNAEGQVVSQAATVAKLTITAPFSGRLGISNVNPGQYINPGDKIVTLQSLDPIYVDFYLPQQYLAAIQLGQPVEVTVDAFPGQYFHGKVTTIDPLIDTNTRNVEVEATVANPTLALNPGMFTNVNITTTAPKSYLTVPQTAVSFNSYGNIVYIVTQQGKNDSGKPKLIANQTFVTTGDTRGDQITILSGLKAGDVIVTTGQLKLRNGIQVIVNNQVEPENNPNPTVTNDHTQ